MLRSYRPLLAAGAVIVVAANCGGADEPGAAGGTNGGGTSSGGTSGNTSGMAGTSTGDAAPDSSPEFPEDAAPETLPRFVHYIRSTPYAKLRLEVDVVPGYAPRETVMQRLGRRLSAVLDKPGGIAIEVDDEIAARGTDYVWSDEALHLLATEYFDDADDSAAGEITMHVMFLDGQSERDDENGRILGLAWGHLHIAMFKQTIESSCGGLGLVGSLRESACEEAEFGIWTHEVGHTVGLVDNGLPMVEDHKDPEHGAHDRDPDCIMYWAYEGQALVDVIGQSLVDSNDASIGFCEPSLADIDAVK